MESHHIVHHIAKRIWKLATANELAELVSRNYCQELAESAQVVCAEVEVAGSGDGLVAIVGQLALKCVSLTKHCSPEEACPWTSQQILIETIALGIALVASLLEPMDSLQSICVSPAGAEILNVLELLSPEFDELAPHLFNGLCRKKSGVKLEPALLQASQRICAWMLVAVRRAVGDVRFNADLIWEWADCDPLWVLVLAKGALTLEWPGCPEEHPTDSVHARPDLAVPSDLHALQDAVFRCVVGLANPAVALHLKDFARRNSQHDEVTIVERAAQLAMHRAQMASAVVDSRLLGPLVHIAGRATDAHKAKFASFLAGILQPELKEDPPWAKTVGLSYSALMYARVYTAHLKTDVFRNIEGLWAVLSKVQLDSHASRSFLKDCCSIAFASPASWSGQESVLRSFMHHTHDENCNDAGIISGVCVLAINFGLQPVPDGDDSLSGFLKTTPPLLRLAVADALSSWKGPVKKGIVSSWMSLLTPQREQLHFQMSIDAHTSSEVPHEQPDAHISYQDASVGSLRSLLWNAPDDLRCMLDGCLLTDPVRSPHGYVFERSAVAEALASNGGVCPISAQPLQLLDCSRDADVRLRAARWAREQRASKMPRLRQLSEMALSEPNGEASFLE